MDNLKRSALLKWLRPLLAAIAALAVLVGVPGTALANGVDPANTGTLVITKLDGGDEQEPLAGATYTVKKVPGIDLTTNDGWAEASALTVAEVASRVASEDPTGGPLTTGNDGVAEFTGLPLGLYYVEETSAPAGYLTAAPFVVALPMTDPDGSGWLYEVHVYPKNSALDIELRVIDQDAIKLGDLVDWKGSSGIPAGDLQKYNLTGTIADQLELVDGAAGVEVGLSCPSLLRSRGGQSCPVLEPGIDFTVVPAAGGGFEVVFTPTGLRKLEAAKEADPGSRVTVSYRTRVLEQGELTNELSVHAVQTGADPEDQSGRATAAATTKWGPAEILVHQVDKPEVLIPGVCFNLYASQEDAKAQRKKIVIDGVSEWVTDTNGQAHIAGLRFSDFANGSAVLPGDPLYRTYYAVMTCVPDGWRGSTSPLPLDVDSVTIASVAVVELYPEPGPGPDPKPTPDGDGSLSKTGAQVMGASILAALALLLGAGLLRRRRPEEKDA